MIILPAIDMLHQNCVRLLRGEKDTAKIYGNPIEWAEIWEKRGAEFLHLVDLDGAFTKSTENRAIIKQIVASLKIPAEVGGGIRTKEDIRYYMEEVNIARVILGTVAIEQPELVEWACKEYSDRIGVGIDAKNGKVMTRGWVNNSEKDAIQLAKEMRDMGVSTIIYTDTTKDGAMCGPNLEMTKRMIEETGVQIIASGGITTLEDIQHVSEIGSYGVIVGKAFYEEQFSLEEAKKRGRKTC